MLLKLNKHPNNAELKEFGSTILLGFGIIGGVLFWRHKALTADAFWGVALIVWAISRSPWHEVTRWLYLAWMGFAFVMGSVMSRVILTLVFWGVITPVALLFKLMKRDVLQLRRNDRTTYWVDHPKIDDPTSYRHLF